MSKKTGIVIKITEKYIVLMMPDGSFKNVKRAYDHTPLLGEYMDAEISSFPAASLRWISVATAAVCMILAALLISGIMQIGSTPAFAVALDINPSMEIQVNSNNRIIGITALNDDADEILKSVDYINKHLDETLSDIIDICIASGYLSKESEGLIYVSVIPIDEQYTISKDGISASLQTALENNNVNAEIDINGVSASALDEAHKLGMSVNRYIIYSELSAEGSELSAEEAGKMPMSELKAAAEEQKNKDNSNSSQVKGNKGNGKNETGKEGNTGKENGKGDENGQGNDKAKSEDPEPKDKTKDPNVNSNPGKSNNGSSQNENSRDKSVDKGNSNSGKVSNSGNNGSNINKNNSGDISNSGSSNDGNSSNNGKSGNSNSNSSGNANINSTKSGSSTDMTGNVYDVSNNEEAAEIVTEDEGAGTEDETGSRDSGGEKRPDRTPKPPVKK